MEFFKKIKVVFWFINLFQLCSFENDEFNVVSASDVTIQIKDSGTNTATTRYLALGRMAKTCVIRPSETITILSINGKTPKAPITCVADQTFTMSKGLRWDNFVIRVETANTKIKVLVT